jgi:hypothetical protein
MTKNKALIILIVMVCIVILISCSQKFPKPLSNEVGILVMPTEINNETEHGFAYKYILSHLPQTSA